MPRNGSGTFNIDITLVPGTTAKASDVNAIAADLGDAITNSIAKDGQTPITSPIKFAAGTAGAPGITFGGDLDTGFYLAGPNQIGIAQGGVGFALLDILLPAGIVKDYAGDTPPAGHLLSYGQAVSRTTYAKLFTAIGTKYGIGDGSTTFNLPDYRGIVTAGVDNMGGVAAGLLTGATMTPNGNTVGARGGGQLITLDISQIPSHPHGVNDFGHSHGANDSGHVHAVLRSAGGGGPNFALFGGQFSVEGDVFTAVSQANISIVGSGSNISIQNNGGGGAHVNIQPTMLQNKIISTGLFS